MSIQRTAHRTHATRTAPAQGLKKAQNKTKQAEIKANERKAPEAEKETRAKGPKRAGSRQIGQQRSHGAKHLQDQLQKRILDPAASNAPGALHGHGHDHAHDHAAEAPDAKQVMKRFSKLTKDGDFTKKDQRVLTEKVQQGGISEAELGGLQALASTKNAKKLRGKDKTRLSTTFTNLLSAYHEQPEVDRKQILNRLRAQSLSWSTTSLAGQLGLQLSQPRPFTLSTPVEEKNIDFSGRETPALTYQMQIDGRKIELVVEQPAVPGGADLNELATALSQVRPELLKHVNRVEILNKSDPTARMQTLYAKEKGTIEVLPIAGRNDVTENAHIFNHEIGHLQSRAALGYDSVNWQAYEKAIAADNRYPSEYAKTRSSEDFSEFMSLHEMFRGTPDAPALRELFPNRYAVAGNLLS